MYPAPLSSAATTTTPRTSALLGSTPERMEQGHNPSRFLLSPAQPLRTTEEVQETGGFLPETKGSCKAPAPRHVVRGSERAQPKGALPSKKLASQNLPLWEVSQSRRETCSSSRLERLRRRDGPRHTKARSNTFMEPFPCLKYWTRDGHVTRKPMLHAPILSIRIHVLSRGCNPLFSEMLFPTQGSFEANPGTQKLLSHK